jgi:surface protein
MSTTPRYLTISSFEKFSIIFSPNGSRENNLSELVFDVKNGSVSVTDKSRVFTPKNSLDNGTERTLMTVLVYHRGESTPKRLTSCSFSKKSVIEEIDGDLGDFFDDFVCFFRKSTIKKLPKTTTLRNSANSMFFRTSFCGGDISGWNVSNVTNMSEMFAGASSFNGDISGWDVSNVTNMELMFSDATSFNGDISGWDVSNVTNMHGIFAFASSFNCDISRWNVSKVKTMSEMFAGASSFNGHISDWDVSNVKDMHRMFGDATSFNGDISGWDVSNVTNMSHLFSGATSFNGDLSKWNVSNVTDMSCMFFRASSFNEDLSKWNVSNVTDMSCMFSEASSFNGDLSKWSMLDVEDLFEMFAGATSFNQDLSSWNVLEGVDITDMFKGATSMEEKNKPRKTLFEDLISKKTTPCSKKLNLPDSCCICFTKVEKIQTLIVFPCKMPESATRHMTCLSCANEIFSGVDKYQCPYCRFDFKNPRKCLVVSTTKITV